MTYLSNFLAKLFSFSFLVSGANYIIAMILFTLITKIILFPIGIWTQKNGIKMVKMKPYVPHPSQTKQPLCIRRKNIILY